jgi:hypothetical protein
LVCVLRAAYFLLFVVADASTMLGFSSEAHNQQVDLGRLQTDRLAGMSTRAKIWRLFVSDLHCCS